MGACPLQEGPGLVGEVPSGLGAGRSVTKCPRASTPTGSWLVLQGQGRVDRGCRWVHPHPRVRSPWEKGGGPAVPGRPHSWLAVTMPVGAGSMCRVGHSKSNVVRCSGTPPPRGDCGLHLPVRRPGCPLPSHLGGDPWWVVTRGASHPQDVVLQSQSDLGRVASFLLSFTVRKAPGRGAAGRGQLAQVRASGYCCPGTKDLPEHGPATLDTCFPPGTSWQLRYMMNFYRLPQGG